MNLASSAPGPEYESPARIAVRVIRDKAVLSATVAKGPATPARGQAITRSRPRTSPPSPLSCAKAAASQSNKACTDADQMLAVKYSPLRTNCVTLGTAMSRTDVIDPEAVEVS